MARALTIYPDSDIYKDSATTASPSATNWYSDVGGSYYNTTGYIKSTADAKALAILGMADADLQTGEIYNTLVVYACGKTPSAGGQIALIDYSFDGGTTWINALTVTFPYGSTATEFISSAIDISQRTQTEVRNLRVRISNQNTLALTCTGIKMIVNTITPKTTNADIAESADTLVFTQGSDMRTAIQSVNPAGVGSVAGIGLLSAAVPTAVASKKRFQVASDSGFSTILGDTTELAANSEAVGTLLQLLVGWAPSTAGTYYARMGVATTDFPTLRWSDVQNIVVGFPANVNLSIVQDGQVLIMTATLDDTYSKPPNVTFLVDADMAQPDAMTVTGSYTYTFTGRLKVTTGWHRVSCLIGNVWTVVNVAQRLVYVPPATCVPDIAVYQNDQRLDVQNVTVNEVCLPDYSTVTFDMAHPIQGNFTVEVQAGGLKRFDMEVTRVDGLTVTGCSRLKRILQEQISLSYLSIAMLDLLQQMVAPWQLQGRTDLITGTWDLLDTTTTKADIVTQIATRCGVAFAEGDGVLNILPFRESQLPEARLAADKNDPTTGYSIDYEGIRNVVRQAFQLDRYPIPPNAATNHDAGQWTGTVSDVAMNANGLVPPSGSPYCLKGNGLVKRTMTFLKGDYDLVHFRYSPAALGQSVELRLYSDATNYWKLSRTYAGAAGAGFTTLGASQNDSVTQTITFTATRLSEVFVATTNTCLVHVELKSGATSLFTSGDMTTDSEGRTVLVPDTVYKAGTMDTIVLTFSRLYAVGSSWGIVCSRVGGKEYYSYLTGTPSAATIDWTDSRTYTLGATGLLTLPTPQTVTLPVHPASPVRTVPAGCLIGGQRYYLHYIVYSTTGTVLRTFDTSLPPAGALPSYGRAFIQDSQLYIDEYGGQAVLSTPSDEAWVIQLCADITLYTLKSTVVTTTVWDYRDWSYGMTYPLWDDVTLKLSDFTMSGTSTNTIVAVGFNAATDFYIDELWLERITPRWQWVEVQDDDSIAQYGRRVLEQKTGDAHSSASATALAAGFLEELKDPAKEYQVTYPQGVWLELGASVQVADTVLSIAALQYGSGMITASIGRATGNLRDTILALAQRQDALEREL